MTDDESRHLKGWGPNSEKRRRERECRQRGERARAAHASRQRLILAQVDRLGGEFPSLRQMTGILDGAGFHVSRKTVALDYRAIREGRL